MISSAILAHRGFFIQDNEQNTLTAFKRALDKGFGIETDLREQNGHIIISHDPVGYSQSPLLFSSLIKLLRQTTHPFKVALNIKTDGIYNLIKNELYSSKLNLNNFFAFDMSIPETVKYVKARFPFYSRVSEYEVDPQFLDAANGIWIDNFTGSYEQITCAIKYLEIGYNVTIVSPELHRRDNLNLWYQIKKSGLSQHPNFQLCTDYPTQAANYFGIINDY